MDLTPEIRLAVLEELFQTLSGRIQDLGSTPLVGLQGTNMSERRVQFAVLTDAQWFIYEEMVRVAAHVRLEEWRRKTEEPASNQPKDVGPSQQLTCRRCGMVGHVATKDSTEPDRDAGRNCRVAIGQEAGELSPPRET